MIFGVGKECNMGELECFEVFGIFWDSLLFSGDVVELE